LQLSVIYSQFHPRATDLEISSKTLVCLNRQLATLVDFYRWNVAIVKILRELTGCRNIDDRLLSLRVILFSLQLQSLRENKRCQVDCHHGGGGVAVVGW
jgi:hypothetical protein